MENKKNVKKLTTKHENVEKRREEMKQIRKKNRVEKHAIGRNLNGCTPSPEIEKSKVATRYSRRLQQRPPFITAVPVGRYLKNPREEIFQDKLKNKTIPTSKKNNAPEKIRTSRLVQKAKTQKTATWTVSEITFGNIVSSTPSVKDAAHPVRKSSDSIDSSEEKIVLFDEESDDENEPATNEDPEMKIAEPADVIDFSLYDQLVLKTFSDYANLGKSVESTLLEVVDFWKNYIQNTPDLLEDDNDLIAQVIGQTMLFVNKKLVSFVNLAKSGNKKKLETRLVLITDIEGYYKGMLLPTLRDLTKRFAKIKALKDNNWVTIPTPKVKKEKSNKRITSNDRALQPINNENAKKTSSPNVVGESGNKRQLRRTNNNDSTSTSVSSCKSTNKPPPEKDNSLKTPLKRVQSGRKSTFKAEAQQAENEDPAEKTLPRASSGPLILEEIVPAQRILQRRKSVRLEETPKKQHVCMGCTK